MTTTHQVICDDCVNIASSFKEREIDLVFTSPPYEDARTYGIDYRIKGQDWVEWTADRFFCCWNACKGLTAFVVEGRTRNFEWSATPAMLIVELQNRGVKLRKPPVYNRVGIPGSGGPDWLRNDYEFVVCGSHGRLPWSDNTACGHEPKYGSGGAPSHRIPDGTRISAKVQTRRKPNGERLRDGLYRPPVKANPGNLIRCHGGGGHLGSKLAHENEAPFPEKLAEFFILSFCPPGGTVFDPFCGSGTVASVCKRLGRSSISVDCRQSQVDLTLRRLEETP